MSKYLSDKEVFIICNVKTNEYFVTPFVIRMLNFIKMSPRTFYRKSEKNTIFPVRFTHHDFMITKGIMIRYGNSE